jgi:hypothetical protein
MFAIIYRFDVRAGQEKAFEKTWHQLTQLIYEHEGSLGSRLHKDVSGSYIAYAQWPDKMAWEAAGDKLPIAANDIRDAMLANCDNIDVLYQLDVVDDMWQPRKYGTFNTN